MTRAVMYPNPGNPDIVHLTINTKWGLPNEDFLSFIATGHAVRGKERCGVPLLPRASGECDQVHSLIGESG